MRTGLTAHQAYLLYWHIRCHLDRLYERRKQHIKLLRWPEVAERLYPYPSAHVVEVFRSVERRAFQMWMDALSKEIAQYRR